MRGVMQIEPAGTWPGGTRLAWPTAAWTIVPHWPATPMAGWSCSPGRTVRCQTGHDGAAETRIARSTPPPRQAGIGS